MLISGRIADAQGNPQVVELIAIPLGNPAAPLRATEGRSEADGNYSLDLPVGGWVLTTWARGWRSASVPLEVSADQQLDLTIAPGEEGFTLEGSLVNPLQLKLSHMTLRATPEAPAGLSPTARITEDGRFAFDRLRPGVWRIALGEGQPQFDSELGSLGLFQNSFWRLELTRIHDGVAGGRMFAGLILLLFALVVTYALLHHRPKAEDPAADLRSTLRETLQVEVLVNPSTQPLAQNTEVSDRVGAIRSAWAKLGQTPGFDPAQRSEGDRLIKGLGEQLVANRAAELRVYLKALLAQLGPPLEVYFWEQQPWRSLEVLLWGLAGILVNLILTVSRYLRWRTFYRDGIPLHLAQLVCVPLLALVFVYLLSSSAFSVDVAAAGKVELKLSDPLIQAALSFAIGSRPWALWALIQGTADRVLPNSAQAANAGQS